MRLNILTTFLLAMLTLTAGCRAQQSTDNRGDNPEEQPVIYPTEMSSLTFALISWQA